MWKSVVGVSRCVTHVRGHASVSGNVKAFERRVRNARTGQEPVYGEREGVVNVEYGASVCDTGREQRTCNVVCDHVAVWYERN